MVAVQQLPLVAGEQHSRVRDVEHTRTYTVTPAFGELRKSAGSALEQAGWSSHDRRGMSLPKLSQLVKDWGGFERLVAKLHDTGTVQVEHDVVLTGKSGAPRQCDVVIRHREGLYEHLIIVECKYWQDNVSRLHVDALATTVKDLKASKGVIMTAKGFQSGAKTLAVHEGLNSIWSESLHRTSGVHQGRSSKSCCSSSADRWGTLSSTVRARLALLLGGHSI
jgi:hypothetical protein